MTWTPDYLTNNPSEECPWVGHVQPPLPHPVYKKLSLKAFRKLGPFEHQLPGLLAQWPAVNKVKSVDQLHCVQTSRPTFGSGTERQDNWQAASILGEHSCCTSLLPTHPAPLQLPHSPKAVSFPTPGKLYGTQARLGGPHNWAIMHKGNPNLTFWSTIHLHILECLPFPYGAGAQSLLAKKQRHSFILDTCL